MAVTDKKVHKDAKVARQPIAVPVITATTQTDRPFYLHKPGYDFQLEALSLYALSEAGAVTIDGVICGDDAILRAGAITVHSVAEQLALALSRYLVGGRVVEKAAATGITFSAAHVISADRFGVVLIMTDNAGTITTKVPLATQAYTTAVAALAALPAADAGKVAIGHLLIDAKTATAWTANTDDLTATSDVDAVTITTYAAVPKVLSAAIAAVSGERVAGALATIAQRQGKSDKNLVLMYTSDASGALTNGVATAVIRPRPLNQEA